MQSQLGEFIDVQRSRLTSRNWRARLLRERKNTVLEINWGIPHEQKGTFKGSISPDLFAPSDCVDQTSSCSLTHFHVLHSLRYTDFPFLSVWFFLLTIVTYIALQGATKYTHRHCFMGIAIIAIPILRMKKLRYRKVQ